MNDGERKQRGVKISQPIALDAALRDILERHRVIKPPVVPKVELLEKYITVRAWTYEATTRNAGADPGTHVTLQTPGLDGQQEFSATETTLALALTTALCKALENQPVQADLFGNGPLFADYDEDDEDASDEGSGFQHNSGPPSAADDEPSFDGAFRLDTDGIEDGAGDDPAAYPDAFGDAEPLHPPAEAVVPIGDARFDGEDDDGPQPETSAAPSRYASKRGRRAKV